MRLPYRPLFLGFLMVALGSLLQAQAPQAAVPAGPEPARETALSPAVALSHRAEGLKAAFRSGNPDLIEAAIQEVEGVRLKYSVLDVLPLVEGMALWARQEGQAGRADVGLRAVEAVERWAPGHPTLLGTRVILTRQEGVKGWFLSLPDLLRLTKFRMEHEAQRWLWLLQHLGVLRMAATLLLWGWTLALALRYRNVLRHLWEEPLQDKGVKPAVAALLGALILAFPVILGLDPGFAALYWLWLLSPFLTVPEVRVTALIMVLQLAHPALELLEPLAKVPASPSVLTTQVQPQAQAISASTFAALPKGDQAFLRGWAELQQGKWAEAEATFNDLLATHPDKGRVLNNLGVARFHRGDVAQAQKDFDAASLIDGKQPEILLNQSVLAYLRLDTELGAQKQNDARDADPDLYKKLITVAGEQKDSRTYPIPLPDSPERVSALGGGAEADLGMGSVLHEPGFLMSLVLPPLMLALFILRVRASMRQAHATQCIRCGEPFRTTDSGNPEVCSKCHHLFVLKDGLHQESRKRKIDEVGDHQAATRRIHKALIAFLPGLDLVFVGDAREGFMEWILICLAAAMVLATGRSVRYPGEVLPDPLSTWLPIGMVFLFLLYLRSWVKLTPRRGHGA
ncbi:MAG TPA: tetratricopeptide repeat protein [Holophagaceae bacterium]|nr:tetratricopeptide repeat protein [Holophagaceae bacterium]